MDDLHFGWIQRRIHLKKHTWKQQTTTVEGGPVIFFIGEFSPIFDLKQNDFDLCKRFFHGKKNQKNPNSPDFHKNKNSNSNRQIFMLSSRRYSQENTKILFLKNFCIRLHI
jgi:hypothetical protein